MRNLDEEDPFIPKEFGFDMAIGLDKELDPTIGYMTVNKVSFDYVISNNGARSRNRTKELLELGPCDP